MRKVALSLMLAASMAATTLGSTAVFASDATTTESESYTYRYALADFPTNWSLHDNQTHTDSELMQYLEAGFYSFDYNDTQDGYQMVPLVATGDPEDVTAEYKDQYGLDGDEALAWKITIRDDLKWDDGTPIVASDFVKSAELLLNPKAQHHRADMLYAGNLVLKNAKNFLYAGQHAYAETFISSEMGEDEYVDPSTFEKNDDGVYMVDGHDLALSLSDCATWDSTTGLSDYYAMEDYKSAFMKDDVDLYETVLAANANDDGYVPVTDEVVEALQHIVANLHGYATVEDYAAEGGDYAYKEWEEMVYKGTEYPEMSIDEVGIFAPSDTELVLVLEKPLKGFYLKYSLTDSWLVKEDLYKSCESESNGVYNNTYGTSAETTASFGPYKLASYQADKEYVLDKNEYYFGNVDGQYQTTSIVVSCVKEPSTRLEMFLSGELDTYGLTKDDIETYGSSDYAYYTVGESTFFMAMNPGVEGLEAAQKAAGDNINKTILSLKSFREALCYSLDRDAFNAAVNPLSSAAFGLYSNSIISDPEEGIAYRDTEEAKNVLANFWGLSDDIGEGLMYETVDEAVDSITGYNLEMAQEKFNEAYDEAIASGLMDEDDVIEIKIGLPNSESTFYNKGNEFLVNCYTEAVKGTSLEGKLTFSVDDTLGNGFGEALRSQQVDLLFGVGWTGAALDPYSLMEAYTSSEYQYDPSWDTKSADVDITLADGVTYTATAWDWTQAMLGEAVTIKAEDGTTKEFSAGSADDNSEDRFEVLVGLENAVLGNYDLIPMFDDCTAALKSMKIQYATDEYYYGVERGGVQYMTYDYSDAEWDAFVSEQGGKLNYN